MSDELNFRICRIVRYGGLIAMLAVFAFSAAGDGFTGAQAFALTLIAAFGAALFTGTF